MTGTASKRFLGAGIPWAVFWAVVLASSIWFVADSLDSFVYFVTDPEAGPFTARRFTAYIHGAMAIPILFVAPLQFHPGFRKRWPKMHRWTGRAFLTASILAAAIALYLSLEYEAVGSRPALQIFGLLWIFFSGVAWLCAMRKDFVAHRAFMIRSVAVGFAFVWVRMLRESADWLLPYIEDAEMRLTVREYLCFIIPLLTVEIWLTYWPALKKALHKKG